MEANNQYQEKTNALFKRWKDESKGFCSDGLMYKGEIKIDNKTNWRRIPGAEDDLWFNAPKRVLL